MAIHRFDFFQRCFFALLFCILLISSGIAQETSLGIFDATAIWNSREDSRQPEDEKTFGSVKMVKTEARLFYDLYGKGKNQIFFAGESQPADDPDEGFFIFTQRAGSWTLSARVELDDKKSVSEKLQTYFGIMIREQADDPKSPFYAISSQAQIRLLTTFYGISPYWRSHRDDSTVQIKHGSDEFYCPLPSLSSVYLRITRIASQNLLYSEWSADKKKWHALHRMILPLDDSPAYGFYIYGDENASSPAHVRISDVTIHAASYYAERIIVAESFYPGNVHKVLIRIRNLNPDPNQFTIQEHLPAGWTVDSISNGGILKDETITWTLTAEPGTTVLRYLLQSPANTEEDLFLSGFVNRSEIQGNHYLRKSRMKEKTYLSLSNQFMIIIAIPIVMLLIHLTLFILAPALKEHLCYAIYLANAAFSSYTFYQFFLNTMTAMETILLIASWSFTATLLILFLYSLTYRYIPFRFYYFLLGSVLFSLLVIFITLYKPFVIYSYLVFIRIFLIIGYSECLRIVVKEFFAAKEGRLIIMIGVLFYILISLWNFFAGFHLLPPIDIITGIPLINFWIQIVFFLSVSIYLSYDFAKTYRELEQMNIRLEERVEQRTQELAEANGELNATNEYLNEANAELQSANAQLLELDKMKSAFVSQASHDLRTPLTAIKGSLDNLLLGIAGNLNEKQEKIMTRAVKSVDRLTDLVNDVLDLSRIESGRMVLEKSNVPIKTLVKNIVNENKPAADQKQIHLSFDMEEGDYTLHVDGGKIERVVGELVSNAIKYTPENGKVDISLTQTGDQFTLLVKDSGIGMTKEECEKIWDRFYRTNASKQFAKGSGLGLSIAKELVEMHGGTLTVISEVGKETTFVLSLPIFEVNS